jgi:Surface adhesin CshA non-repetitive domain 2
MITITTLNSESCLRQQLVLNVVILQLQRQMILALLAMASLLAVVTSSFAATCGPATSPGTAPAQWQTYCWIDMTYNNATVMAGGQAFSVTLSDGSIFAFTLSATTVGATGLVAIAPPSWTGSAVGNTAFLGIPNKPILYTTAGGTVNLTMSNITITPPSGGVSTGIYKIVVADAESSNNGESLTYTTNGGNWTVIDQVDPISGAVYPTISNSGSVFTTTGVAVLCSRCNTRQSPPTKLSPAAVQILQINLLSALRPPQLASSFHKPHRQAQDWGHSLRQFQLFRPAFQLLFLNNWRQAV